MRDGPGVDMGGGGGAGRRGRSRDHAVRARLIPRAAAVIWVGFTYRWRSCSGWAWVSPGWTAAGQFYAGYLTEYSLSLDNLFVFYVIMSWLAVPAGRQQRVLLFGIGLALVLRTGLIVAGAAAVNRFGWLFYPLGGFLLWTAFGLIRGRTDNPAAHRPGRVLRFLRGRIARRAGLTGPLASAESAGPGARSLRPCCCWSRPLQWRTCCSRSTRSRPSSASPPSRC